MIQHPLVGAIGAALASGSLDRPPFAAGLPGLDTVLAQLRDSGVRVVAPAHAGDFERYMSIKGPELIPGPLDLTSAQWSGVGTLSSVTATTMTNTSGSGAGRTIGGMVPGKLYEVIATYTKSDATTEFQIIASGGSSFGFSTAASGTIRGIQTAGNGALYLRLANSCTVTITSLSLRELYGVSGGRGPERVANGGFDADIVGWGPGGQGTPSWDAGALRLTSTSAGANRSVYSIATEVNKTYQLTGRIRCGTAGGVMLLVSNNSALNGSYATSAQTASTTYVPVNVVFTASATTTYIGPNIPSAVAAGETAFIDDISVREVLNDSQCTLFEDAAGTIPVTRMEQQVGLRLDRTYMVQGPVYGPERVTNGNFDTNLAGWTASDGGWTWDNGRARLTGSGAVQVLNQPNGTLEIGKTYFITFEVSTENGAIGVQGNGGAMIASGSSGTVTALWKADLAYLSFKRAAGVVNGWIDKVSVREVIVEAGQWGRGPELVANGDFANGTTGWTSTAGGTQSVSGGVLTVTNVSGEGGSQQALALVSGKTYEVLYEVVAFGGGATVHAVSLGGVRVTGTPGTGLKRLIIQSGGSVNFGVYTNTTNAGHSVSYRAVSTREIPGHHASQANASSKGVITGRRNMLPCSDLTTAVVGTLGSGGALPSGWAWSVQAGMTKQIVAKGRLPDGRSYMDVRVFGTNASGSIQYQDLYMQSSASHAPAAPGQAWTASVTTQLLAGDANAGFLNLGRRLLVAGFNSSGGYIEGQSAAAPTVSTETRQTATRGLVNANITNARCAVDFTAAIGGTIDVTVRLIEPQLEMSALPMRYQEVRTATDYDWLGFPLRFKYDGFDDGYATSTVDFTGTDKVSVVAAVTKLSDAAVGTVIESSAAADGGANTGTFLIRAPAGMSPTYVGAMKGSSLSFPASISGYPAPSSNVLAMRGDIGGAALNIRIDGVDKVTSALTLGTGTFGNHPFNIGRRNQSSLPFNGEESLLVIAGAKLTDTQLRALERVAAQLQKGSQP